MRSSAIAALVKEHGPNGYLQIQASLLAKETVLPNGRKVRKAEPEQFSLAAMWEGLVGPIEDTLPYALSRRGGFIDMPSVQGALTSSAFPSAVGQLISQKVIDGYDNTAGMIGDQLVTTMPSTMRGERMVGFTAAQGPKIVEEDGVYEESTIGEKYVTTNETKRGRIIAVTEESVFFDQTGQLLLRAQRIGEAARQDRERRIVRGVIDAASTERVWRPSGTAAQLYVHATNTNLLATATVLTDWTDIQEAMAYHAANMRDDREPDDENGTQPIPFLPKILLVATKLAGVAALICNAINPTTMVNAPNMVQQIAPGLTPLSSPFIDAAEGADQFDDMDDWYLGDPKRQFIYKEIWPLQTFTLTGLTENAFRRDRLAEYKVREYGDVNAIDTKYLIKVNAV